jgi:hypothetical protein
VAPSGQSGEGVRDKPQVGEDPRREFIFGYDANAAEHGPGDLGEEAFHEIEPRTMFRGKHQGEAALTQKLISRLVEDQHPVLVAICGGSGCPEGMGAAVCEPGR